MIPCHGLLWLNLEAGEKSFYFVDTVDHLLFIKGDLGNEITEDC